MFSNSTIPRVAKALKQREPYLSFKINRLVLLEIHMHKPMRVRMHACMHGFANG